MGISPDDQWESLSGHLDVLLDLPDGERSGYVDNLELTEPELALELRRLLARQQDEEFSQFLDVSPAVLLEPTESTLIGRQVGAYVIDEEVGRGGMGSVWRAHRADGRFEGNVAVKLVHAVWIGGDGERRFRSEGRMLAQLNHPNIARLIDAGMLDGTQPYLVLEYVEGEPIDVFCGNRGLDVRARIELFLNVLSAVAHAHSHLIVHRDVKPSNIFVARDGTVKLLDFGIAKLLSEDTDLTKTGGAALTPQFAAPEQVLGKPITTTTDVYALGLVLYLLLSGRPPSAQGMSSADLIHQIVVADPPPLSAAASLPGIGSRELAGDLDNILAKALKKSPAERYASVDAFADDLTRYLTDQPVMARADSVAYRVGKFLRRHRLGVALSALTAVMLLAAMITVFLQKLEADRQRNAAQVEARIAQSANEFLNLLLQSEGGSKEGALTPSQRVALGAQMLERQYGDDPQFAGRMLVQLSRQTLGEDKTRQAVDLDTRAYALGQRAHDPELMALAQCVAAYTEESAAIFDRAPARLEDASRLLATRRQSNLLVQVDCDRARAQLAFRRNDTHAAESILLGAKAKLEGAGETYRKAYETVLTDLADVFNEDSRFSDAAELMRLAEETDVRYGRGGTSARLMTEQNQAVLLGNMGEIREALELLDDVRRRRRAIQGEASEPLSLILVYAGMMVERGDAQRAVERMRAAADNVKASGNAYWYDVMLRTLCGAYLEMGDLANAQSTFAQLEAALAGAQGDDVYLRGSVAEARAKLDLQRGDARAALTDAGIALKALGADAGDKSSESREGYDLAATAALRLANLADADRYAQRALDIAAAVARGDDTSGNVGQALLVLARVRIAQGRVSEAKSLLERARRCLRNGFGPDSPAEHEVDEAAAQTA